MEEAAGVGAASNDASESREDEDEHGRSDGATSAAAGENVRHMRLRSNRT